MNSVDIQNQTWFFSHITNSHTSNFAEIPKDPALLTNSQSGTALISLAAKE
jgi:hypothetical protein